MDKMGTKKVTKDNKIVIEIEEPMRKKTLTTTRKVMIPPRSYAVFDVEGEEWEGMYEIRPNPFLKQREPNLWMDNFMLYNIPGKEDGLEPKDRIETQGQETTEGSEGNDPSEGCVGGKEE